MYEFYDLFSVFLRLLKYTTWSLNPTLGIKKPLVTSIDKSRYIC
jgi:hypothetical protein